MDLTRLIETVPVLASTGTLATAVNLILQTSSAYLVVTGEQGFSLLTSQALLMGIVFASDWQALTVQSVPLLPVTALTTAEDQDFSQLLAFFERDQCPALPVTGRDRQVIGLLRKSAVLEQFALEQRAAEYRTNLGTQRSQLLQKEQELVQLSTILDQKQEVLDELALSLLHNEKALQHSQAQIDSILNSIEDVVWSLQANTLQILYINASVLKVYGRSAAAFVQNRNLWQQVIHPEDQDMAQRTFQDIYLQEFQDQEFRVVWPNGEIRWVRNRARLIKDSSGNPLRIDGITSDITTRRDIQEQLRHDAFHDKLTGLANRALLSDRIVQSLRHRDRQRYSCFAILFLDLDRFKVINDSLGHQAGDQILLTIAQRLQSCQREVDTLARLGGDEFVILLEDLENPAVAVKVAERIHQVLSEPILLNGHEISVTTSIGITFGDNTSANHADPVAALLRDADTAMYRAKASGTGQHTIFDNSMHQQALAELYLENDLRRVLQSLSRDEPQASEMAVYYQPIFSLHSEQLCGFEALIRWQHPIKGLLAPDQFLWVAEATGQIVALDYWVLQTACRQQQLWSAQFPSLPPLSININLSSRHFESPGLIELVDQMLLQSGIPGHLLKLEITETLLISNPEKTNQILQQLQERQVQICLDDFGTGYSSLSYLHNFPFNCLKIDRSFLQQIEPSSDRQKNKEVVRTIIQLGTILGMDVVAEGIENVAQVEYLKLLNCQYGQGFFYSRPIDAEAMTCFLAQQVS